MVWVKVNGRLFWEQIFGSCTNKDCEDGPGSGVRVDCQTSDGKLLRYCGLCGHKLKITIRRVRTSPVRLSFFREQAKE